MFNIAAISARFDNSIQLRIDQKTKPVGALGQIEKLAATLASINATKTGTWQVIEPLNARVLVFAADHGIAAQGVSIAPSAVTHQMVANFLNGGAAINCFCRSNDLPLDVVDAGIIEPIPEALAAQVNNFVEQRLGAGTNDFSQQAAMSRDIVDKGIEYGRSVVNKAIAQGCNLLLLGEMGIGNTSSATALASVLTGRDVSELVGVGTGISDEQLTHKAALISQAVQRYLTCHEKLDIYALLAELGGFEIVQMTGAILAAAQAGIPVLIDGFIVTAAALSACSLHANVRDYLIFSHQSDEQGHRVMLEHMQAKPLLNLALRLGEGTGAALAYPLLRAAVVFYNEMASFESAGIDV